MVNLRKTIRFLQASDGDFGYGPPMLNPNWKVGLFNALGLVVISLIFLVGPLLLSDDKFPTKRGFFCDDDSIRYPYRPNTVAVPVAGAISFSIVILSIMLGEFVVYLRISPNMRSWRAYIMSVIAHNGYWILGIQILVVLIQVAKYTVGRLRPHFLDVCKITNLDALCPPQSSRFVLPEEYMCTGDSAKVREARISFFSGHSAVITFCAIYAVLYLQARIGSRIGTWRAGLCILQSLLVGVALYICCSRVTDYWHHHTDVITGVLIGMAAAIWTAVVWAGLFTRNKERYCKETFDDRAVGDSSV